QFCQSVVWSPPQGRHKPHCWLTNRTKAPAAITTAIRTPTTNDVTGWRLGLTSFALAPFCAAPMPNQKRSLSIGVYRRTQDTSLDGRQLGIARIPQRRGGQSRLVRVAIFRQPATKQNPVGRCGTGGVLGLGPAVPYRSLVGENDEPGDGRDLSRSLQLR